MYLNNDKCASSASSASNNDESHGKNHGLKGAGCKDTICRTQNERQFLINFLNKKLKSFIRANEDCQTLYHDLIE